MLYVECSSKIVDDILNDVKNNCKIITKQKRGRTEKKEYYEVASAFDIETSSWVEDDKKMATMYVWQFGINGNVIIGRTWKQLIRLLNKISKKLELNDNKNLIVYVHNLSFEFQFMEKWLDWKDVFYLKDRNPIKANTKNGIEFRCSYALSGKSLENTAKDLLKYKASKKIGKLDYHLLRHSNTKLTDDEIEYCIYDVIVVMNYIKEKIENEGIINIPLTKTGYVRKLCKDACFGKGEQRKKYHSFINKMKMNDEVYRMMKDAFQGGYVHCNPLWSERKIPYVGSFDFNSSYPTVLVAFNEFPMSSGKEVEPTKENYYYYYKHKCVLAKIAFKNIRLKRDQYCSPISKSKCNFVENYTEDNGRIESAEFLSTTITEQDFFVYERFYDWDDMKVLKMYVFEPGYIPTPIVNVILDLYKKKTELKGVCEGNEELELEYMISKENLNSIYGMMVTDIMTLYDDMEDHNSSYSRFLFYGWGVWTTAIARKMLFSGIHNVGRDFVYSDTDSIKIMNYEEHIDYIERYNNFITKKLDKALKYRNIDVQMSRPSNCMGQEKQMGIWEFEGVYSNFKAIRAKAYMYEENGNYNIAVSGLSKNAVDYLVENGDPFEQFKDGMYIPAGRTGKTGHYYIDEYMDGCLTDYLGNTGVFEEKSGIYVFEADYTLKIENNDIVQLFMNALKEGGY